MGLWNWLFGEFNGSNVTASASAFPEDIGSTVNPATGLPMLSGGMSGVDAGGSPYGTDMHSSTAWGAGSTGGSEVCSALD